MAVKATKAKNAKRSEKFVKEEENLKKQIENKNESDVKELSEKSEEEKGDFQEILDLDLHKFIEECEEQFEEIGQKNREIDLKFNRKLIKLEVEKFEEKKTFFLERKKKIEEEMMLKNSFWRKVLLFSSEVEMHMMIEEKEEEVQNCDFDFLQNIEDFQVELFEDVDKKFFGKKVSFKISEKNRFIENKEIFRILKIPFDSNSKIEIETSKILPKKDYLDLLEKLKHSNKDKQHDVDDNDDFAFRKELMPFLYQFLNEKCEEMNEFHEILIKIFENPIDNLKFGLEEFREEFFDQEEDDDDDDEELLSEIEEEEEEESLDEEEKN